MKLIKISAIIVASAVIVACGGEGSSSSGASSSGSSTIIKDGENTFTSTEGIETVLDNTTEVTENQDVIFVLPEDSQTLALKTDLKVTGNLTIK